MRISQTTLRAVCATAATFLPSDRQPAAPRDLIRAVSAAVERRLEDEDLTLGEKYYVREAAVEAVGPWSNRWARADLASELCDVAREGLDLTELVGAPYGLAAGRIWWHGAFSASRVIRRLHGPRSGLSFCGRPWVNVWVDDEHAVNPRVLRAEFTGGRRDTSGQCPVRSAPRLDSLSGRVRILSSPAISSVLPGTSGDLQRWT
ncbi:hypothetical protein ACIQMV_19200 [Streptomyces sp. NPDC091412]|uniref:hypothetical protein n=1 Tax=Streptomyces sp. NPDC091412 TaxID=3366002 RepID=UPI00382BD9AB